MKVVIAEKPSVARDLARVMGAKEVKDGYIAGNGYAFTYAFGHLVQLCTPQAYGYNSWTISNLPIIPANFKLESKKVKRDGKQMDDTGAVKQLNTIKSLLEQAEEIIVATDAGRKGSLSFVISTTSWVQRCHLNGFGFQVRRIRPLKKVSQI
ncbi:toprim domain-containing protein [Sphingobacterium sp. E70]|uniref:toprim domain-containing protein n=1 Tax=Sphingobacterium sp. E70 TaxID=2853439 RepID=UPI00211BB901|nr:toprim domain-containing protein [Sphingobacterium sp. E70]ULT27740.1 toprim domain-containing protein [Sphingobacterium sp. E70]